MSTHWSKDISDMHQKFGVNKWFTKNKSNKELMKKYLMFRMLMLNEELHETMQAVNSENPEEIVDGLIDICVFAIGTLNVLEVDADKAWDAIHNANMAKEPGVKAGRPNPFGMPDLLKPEGWKGPDHSDNHGSISDIL
jgi:predicted HAD superfamily Cof-like phosphohydrolase|tara:strand:- start:454 stop:867 length:414 start_codon:yes stop_codon:yes gene_type:complete